jgi:hypothetical protein
MLTSIRNFKYHNDIRHAMLFDEAGADALPMRFVAAAVLMGIIVALSATALADFSRDAQVKRFSADLSALEARASVIYQQGGARDISDPADNTGTMEIIRFKVPEGIEVVVFGAMPPHDGTIPVLTSPGERNIIYYTTYQGVTKTAPSKAKYAAVPDLGGPVVLVPGSYELTIELVKDSSGTYITLY